MTIKITDIIDQNSDVSLAVLRKFASMLSDKEFGDTVWAMSNERAADVGLHKVASSKKFAFPEASLFPVDTERDTILSKVYFDGQRQKLAADLADRVSSRLSTYLDLYGVPDCFGVHIEKTASAQQDFTPRCLMPSTGMYKVATVANLNSAYEDFDKNLPKYSLAERVEFSKEFAKVATTIRKQSLPSTVQRYCGVMDTDLDNVRTLLHIRKVAALRAGKSGAEYEKLASALEDVTGPTKEELEKLACTINDLDEAYGFTSPKYDRKMPDAYALVFNKEAAITEETGEAPEPKAMTKADVISRFGLDAVEALEDEDGELDEDKLKLLLSKLPDKQEA